MHWRVIGIGAGFAAAVAAGPALAQQTGTPPSWDTLTHCAAMPSDAERLGCYDAAMRAAGYAPNPEAVVAERHRRFGLPEFSLNILHKESREKGEAVGAPAGSAAQAAQASQAAQPGPAQPTENENRIEVQIDEVATILNGKVLLVTTDGGVWEQTDQVVVHPFPKPGQTIIIRRERLGGFFCDVNKYQTVRCRRTH